MKKRLSILLGSIMGVGIVITLILYFDREKITLGTVIGYAFLSILIPNTFIRIVDCFDNTTWKSDLRKLYKNGELKKEGKIRISFAYLFRIKVDDKYFLVLNDRGTQKYQPVGGAYQYLEEEKIWLANKFKIAEDNKIVRDEASKNDYRLFVPAMYLCSFIKRFDKTRSRERVDNLSREFEEELIKTGILDFDHITYRFCGRHFSKIVFSRHFQCYELLLADIVELLLTDIQRDKLRNLISVQTESFKFATTKEILSCGVNEGTIKLAEIISDHTFKILQETEATLSSAKGSKKSYGINLNTNL